jgi:hypothetical protein
MGEASDVRFRQLQDLRYHWGEAYSIDLDNGEFVASRRDNWRELRAAGTEELHEMIIIDYSENRIPRGVGE